MFERNILPPSSGLKCPEDGGSMFLQNHQPDYIPKVHSLNIYCQENLKSYMWVDYLFIPRVVC
jgi:hypothetical protein